MSEGQDGLSVVYVLGSSRGGTSIVGRFIGLLPGATFAGEVRRLWGPSREPGRVCGCGRPHAECEVWSGLLREDASFLQPNPEAIAALQDRVAPVHRSWWHASKILRFRSAPLTGRDEGRYLKVLCDLYEALARASGSRVIVDSSKNAGDAALLSMARGITIFCVHVVRDPRGVVLSRRRRSRGRREVGGRLRPRPLGALRTTAYWILTHLTAEMIRRRYGRERSLLVRYETFADQPASMLTSAAHMLGIATEVPEPAAGVAVDVPPAHGPDGNGRFAGTEVIVRLDERWRTELHPIDRFAVTLLAYPLLRRYGYRAREPRAGKRDRSGRRSATTSR